MSNKSRRRVLAVGAFLAGASIPLAAAGTAWAGTDLSVNGVQVYDSFTGGDQPAQSSPGGNVAEYTGPQADGGSVHASDVTGDTGDTAIASNSNTSQAPSNATITDATNSTANASNGGQAAVQGNTTPGSVTNNDHATASGAGTLAGVENNGSGTVSNNYATASNTNGTTVQTNATVNGESAGVTNNNNASGTNGGNAIVQNEGGSNLSFNNASATGTGTDAYTGGRSEAAVASTTAFGPNTQPVEYNSATASNGGLALVGTDGNASQPVEFNAANGNSGVASVVNGMGTSATALNTGTPTTISETPNGIVFSPGAYVNEADVSTAYAQGAGATAGVQGEPTSYVFNDHAIQTVPGSTVITYPTSNSTVMNDPPPAVHSAVVPVAPAPMMPLHMPLLP